MLRLSVISDEVSQDPFKVMDFARRFRLKHVEIRTAWDLQPQDLTSRAKDLRELLSSNGLRVCAIASPVFKADLSNEAEYVQHLEILRRVSALAGTLGTSLIRVFAFWRSGEYETNAAAIQDRFRKAIDIAEDEGIVLCLENEPATFLTNGGDVSDFVKRLGSRSVKVVWDPGNDIMDPDGEMPYPDGYCKVRGLIAHVHLKDGVRSVRGGQAEFVPIGDGEVNLVGQMAALMEDGFGGCVSLETHWRPSGKLSESQISTPGGTGFSGEGMVASEICMRNLQELLRTARQFTGNGGAKRSRRRRV